MEKLVADTRPAVEPKLKALQEAVSKRLGLEPPATSKKPTAPAAKASAAKK